MNSYQAKRIPLKDILAALGYSPAKEVRGELWYLSPFRDEAEASFKINQERNIWYDFGLGEGGNVIDFSMHYFKTGAVASALRSLDDLMGGASVPRRPSPTASRATSASAQATHTLDVGEIKPLENNALIQYLRSRAIPAEIARSYVQEIHYRREGKPYFALAFPNRSGGYELRNPYFKGSYGVKDISILKVAEEVEQSRQIAVFEGFMDFLSALVYSRVSAPTKPALVLNSVAMRARGIEFLRSHGVRQVHLYFDHDHAGRELTAQFQTELEGITVVDQSAVYGAHKDFNEFLIDKRHGKR